MGLTNTLYAVPFASNDLQIIDGRPDPEIIVENGPVALSTQGAWVSTRHSITFTFRIRMHRA